MNSGDTNAVLNRAHALHSHSLPSYLNYAKPWPLRGDEAARDVLQHIVIDQQQTADRLASLIMDNGDDVLNSEYPMYFTSLHDLSYEYLVGQLVAHQKQDIATMEECVTQLDLAPFAKAVVEEALGAAKGHMDSLVELTQPSGESVDTA